MRNQSEIKEQVSQGTALAGTVGTEFRTRQGPESQLEKKGHGKLTPVYTALQPRRQPSLYSLP
jgi:hypothetical protein